MRRTIAVALTGALTALAAGVGALSPVQAASPIWTYYSTSGGTQANLIGSTVSTDLTGASNLGGTAFNDSRTNGVASVNIPGILKVGAITTSQVASPFGTDGVQMKSTSKIAGIDLLSGAIKIDAVDEVNIVRANPQGFTREVTSKLATLTIGGKAYPLEVAPNTKITIPGLAEVTINKQIWNAGPSGAESKVSALEVTLLKDVAGGKIGSTIRLAPSTINFLNGSPSAAIPVGGFAYGTAVVVGLADIRAAVPPTAMLQIPSIGTGGKLYENSTLKLDVPGVLSLGAIESKVSGVSNVGSSDAFATNKTARINVLNGLITADAITVTSHVAKGPQVPGGHLEEQRLEFINLKVAGKSIPINVAKNTQIFLLGIGTVYINQQLDQPGYSAIVGVRLIVSGKGLGLPVGADVQLGVASTFTAAS